MNKLEYLQRRVHNLEMMVLSLVFRAEGTFDQNELDRAATSFSDSCQSYCDVDDARDEYHPSYAMADAKDSRLGPDGPFDLSDIDELSPFERLLEVIGVTPCCDCPACRPEGSDTDSPDNSKVDAKPVETSIPCNCDYCIDAQGRSESTHI